MDLKQHNLIPEDAQAIVEMYQLREYCILHLAWTRLQQKHASNEEKKLFFTTVGNLIISLLLRLFGIPLCLGTVSKSCKTSISPT